MSNVWGIEGIIDELKAEVKTGKSMSQIADALNRKYKVKMTRNAVIGKCLRLGIASRGNSPRTTRAQRRRAAQKIPQHARPTKFVQSIAPDFGPTEPVPLNVADEIVIPENERMSLLIVKDGKVHANDAFTAQCCHWPIGDPRENGFHYCGKEAVPGKSYCEFHMKKMFPTPEPRRKKMDGFAMPSFSPKERDRAKKEREEA